MDYKKYAWAVLGTGLAAATIAGLYTTSEWSAGTLVTMTLIAGLVFVTGIFPLKMSPQAEASLAAAPIFAGVLLLSPFQTAIVATVATSAAGIRLGRKPLVWSFNGGVAALAATASGVVFQSVVPVAPETLFTPRILAAGFVSGFLLQSTNLAAMVGLISFRKGMSFWTMWRRSWVMDAVQESGTVALGFLGAGLFLEAWWSVVLLVAPLGLAHIALGHSVKEARQNIAMTQKLEAQMKELREAQEHLIQSAKMASVGTLAAGIAHEINNPLFVMMGRAELLLRHKEKHLRSERARQYLVTIHEQGARAAQIVRELLAYSRDGLPVQEIPLSDAVDKAVGLVGKLISPKNNIQIKREYSQSSATVQAVPTKIQQVFVNLLQNAKDAMPDGGNIYLRCWTENGYACAAVRDSGQGMPKEIQERVFEPFFTTKDVGHGTGLGLYICHQIVTEHKGRIRIESELGKGTEVVIELPVSTATPAVPITRSKSAA